MHRWHVESKDRLELTNDLGHALREDALEVHYQPVIELATATWWAWRRSADAPPARRWIPPTIFVPLAEESGLIADFDRWVLNRACRDGAELRASGLLPPDALLSVNISARNVSDLGLVDAVREAATSNRFPLEALELEVTETVIMAEVPTIRVVLEGIRELGVGISLDYFGMGYSSLTFVRQLPVTTIKIDRSFTQHITRRREDLAICAVSGRPGPSGGVAHDRRRGRGRRAAVSAQRLGLRRRARLPVEHGAAPRRSHGSSALRAPRLRLRPQRTSVAPRRST